MNTLFPLTSGAAFSPCKRYRYWLTREWSSGECCVFCMLNPSTADEVENDPTVSRCINFAKYWNYGRLIVVNIFAFRSTDPKALAKQSDPVGLENDHYILKAANEAHLFVCAWGTHGRLHGRGAQVRDLIRSTIAPHCLNKTKDGHPVHPLYQKSDLWPMCF